MTIGLIFTLLFLEAAFGQSYGQGSPKEFKNLTSEKYNGADEDLRNFEIVKMDQNCDRLMGKCALTWDHISERRKVKPVCKMNESCPTQELKSYIIHFEVKDRKGNSALQKTLKFEQGVARGEGKVGRTSIGYYAELGEVNMNYATVLFWVTDIKWSVPPTKAKTEQKYHGAAAFSLEEHLKRVNKGADRTAE
ncbi:MAG: hypothetical protein K2Q26_09055 [Bdellovibrionales bacterium]|nr:hypothetical protein [Bdellovibrionales bacterium]